ncbi:kinase-like domain-containing protein [Cercophora newfieldiana]|uniref:non-specific serine/threonine protein kinase n=1 Tax=Cercophora newfieldiana TaxID=92897 RepID=A0AA39YNR6_9PEZI|nr:kinase-like domain-containing protein [Cercophora newfieldiana]
MAVSVLAAAATQTSSLASPPNHAAAATQTQAKQPPVAGAPSVASSSTTAPLPIAKPAPHPNTNSSSNFSSLSSSPRQFPTDLTSSILEEGDETESEPANEPVTPVSGRQSQDFHTLTNPDVHPEVAHDSLATDQEATPFSNARTAGAPGSKPTLALNTNATPQRQQQPPAGSAISLTPIPATPPAEQEPTPIPLSRRSTRSSTLNFKRSMTSFFKRTSSTTDGAALGGAPPSGLASDVNLAESSRRKTPSRRWSMNKSSATTRSNTPPSPGSPLEMAVKTKEQASTPTVPSSEVFFEGKKKARAATGFSLRARVANVNNKKPHPPMRRRASSFDYSKQQKAGAEDPNDPIQMERAPWGMPAESGTGVKARRMSLSLPDDFTVDVAELMNEYDYHHKFLGRHGKHLGKGATSKVTLMVRKGYPGELYAVKEFRGKSSSETREEYEKKIKSEYTLAKSLHHPSIVETVRLCTSHGRWNHVMEYCQEGDLFSLVSKGYLKQCPPNDREKDRQCLFKQLVQGINYLHTNGIAHRDIKLENLLMTSDSKLKITDFGVSEVFCGIHPGLREAGGQCGMSMGALRRCAPGICGSEPYIAPEVLRKAGEYDPRALDVWSSAIVMINLIFGAPMWRRAEASGNPNYADLVTGWNRWMAKNESDVTRLGDLNYPHVLAFDKYVSPPALRRILLQMLHPDPEKRITIADVVKNRWVKGIECCQLESYDEPSRTIDASKKASLKCGGSKTFCHNHLPPKESNTHSLGPMPGKAGY